ncbi:MAG: hypothetical protein ABII12_03580 [Planctomycetota bacterium]
MHCPIQRICSWTTRDEQGIRVTTTRDPLGQCLSAGIRLDFHAKAFDDVGSSSLRADDMNTKYARSSAGLGYMWTARIQVFEEPCQFGMLQPASGDICPKAVPKQRHVARQGTWAQRTTAILRQVPLAGFAKGQLVVSQRTVKTWNRLESFLVQKPLNHVAAVPALEEELLDNVPQTDAV